MLQGLRKMKRTAYENLDDLQNLKIKPERESIATL